MLRKLTLGLSALCALMIVVSARADVPTAYNVYGMPTVMSDAGPVSVYVKAMKTGGLNRFTFTVANVKTGLVYGSVNSASVNRVSNQLIFTANGTWKGAPAQYTIAVTACPTNTNMCPLDVQIVQKGVVFNIDGTPLSGWLSVFIQ